MPAMMPPINACWDVIFTLVELQGTRARFKVVGEIGAPVQFFAEGFGLSRLRCDHNIHSLEYPIARPTCDSM
jgi:hypothetical protein